MLNTKKPAMKALFVISLIFLAVALVLSAIQFTQPTPAGATASITICTVVGILAIFAGFVYVLGGYKKNDALFYKLFMLLVCLESVLTLVNDIIITQEMGSTSPISGILRTIICVNLVILVFAKDLGKQTSIGLASAVFGVTIINHARLLVLYFSFSYVISAVLHLSLALLVLLLVIGKYMDKTERGTK